MKLTPNPRYSGGS